MKTFLLTLIAISSAPLPCSSSTSPSNRDINTYGSYSNPNVAYSHYWADANNVLQDLSSFKKLYVKYHGCAWSTTSYSTGVQEEAQDDYYDTESDVSKGCTGNAQQAACENCYYDANGEKHYYTTNDQNQDDQNNNQNDQNNNQNDQNENQNDQNNNQNDQNNNQNDQDNNENDQENNQNDQNNNQNDENNNQNDAQRKKKRFLEDGGGQNCGNEAASCDQWWVGMQSCMGANVAYSLYGHLSGDGAHKFNPCNRDTFINSFFTKDGLTNFAQASNGAVDISSLNQQCASNGNGYGTSTSCSFDGTFTVDTFNGGCFGKNYVATTDTLDTLNNALESDMDCVLIYSSDKGSTNYASNLLSQSQQCSFDMDSCPDPHGLVEKYEFNFAMAQRYTKYKVPDSGTGNGINVAIASVLCVAGLALLIRRFRPLSHEGEVPDLFVNPYIVSA